eukprot:TRINITY_DN4612_c0_g1_i1.p1 TRINITY_DN4612_c0_g1~~TRINITY_DN4612_c0_g1_i1.p1  ORF type:complete len:198 (+),score=30.42 TRINITY_DN4612_c0_g1_i1:36-629(+)
MPIYYACIAKGTNILLQAGPNKKYKKIVAAILGKITRNEQKSYVYEGNKYNYTTTNGYTFLCVTNNDYKTRICFAFLKQLELEWDPSESTKYQAQLEEHMKSYSDPANVDKASKVQNKISEVKEIMMENIDAVLERGENLKNLHERTTELESNSIQFSEKATEVKKKNGVEKSQNVDLAYHCCFGCDSNNIVCDLWY